MTRKQNTAVGTLTAIDDEDGGALYQSVHGVMRVHAQSDGGVRVNIERADEFTINRVQYDGWAWIYPQPDGGWDFVEWTPDGRTHWYGPSLRPTGGSFGDGMTDSARTKFRAAAQDAARAFVAAFLDAHLDAKRASLQSKIATQNEKIAAHERERADLQAQLDALN